MPLVSLQVGLGRALKARRAELGISQEDVARRSELARSYISAAERGTINVSVGQAERLADAVELTLTELFARVEAIRASSGRG